jgi:uncharacterized protein (TIGR04442 family)
MHQEIREHGHLDDAIEYYAVMAAHDAYARYFFETDGDGLRFFAPGNEFVLGQDRISHRGNGGSFCNYMFGIDQPLADLCKGEVRNRLILFGAYCTADGQLEFSEQTEGYSRYDRVFVEGNAYHNYYFFLNGAVAGGLGDQQESIARLLGKTLKRSPHVGGDDDTGLLQEIYALLGHRSSLCMIKLVHKHYKGYRDAFRELYFTSKAIPEEAFQELQLRAERWRIDRTQQERIRIDVMCQHPDNRRIVDEYRNLLVDGYAKGHFSQPDQDRLTRLRTLSIRNKIPAAALDSFAAMLQHGQATDPGEQDCLAASRQVLGGIFLGEAQIDASLTAEDIKLLLHAKRQASEQHDRSFEQLLLETGRACDEKVHRSGDPAPLAHFTSAVTYLDRYDNAYAGLNELVFMMDVRCPEEKIRSLLGNKRAFDRLDPSLWEELFFQPVYANKYLGRGERRKAECLAAGLPAIEAGRLTVVQLREQLGAIEAETRFLAAVLTQVKERIRNFFAPYTTPVEQEALLREVAAELQQQGLLSGELSPALFRDVLVSLNKEAIYLQHLLPQIVAGGDLALREDFLANSGLERFYIEELEREYFELHGLGMDRLYRLRKGAAG